MARIVDAVSYPLIDILSILPDNDDIHILLKGRDTLKAIGRPDVGEKIKLLPYREDYGGGKFPDGPE